MTGTHPDRGEEQLQTYLDQLLLALRGRPRDARRLLAEVEAHLHDAIDAGLAAGTDRADAVRQALHRFGPPSAVARGLPCGPAYRVLAAQLAAAVPLLTGLLCLAVGLAGLPAAIVGLAGDADLITGDPPSVPGPARCRYLTHLTTVRDCAQALSTHHLVEVVRAHLVVGVVGFVLVAVWWVLHAERRTRPGVLPAGFNLAACATVLAVAALPALVTGLRAAAAGTADIGGVIGSADLLVTASTVLAVSLTCWTVLARQVTRPARNLLVPRARPRQ
jgi:HAAS domain-containing protein